MEKITAGKYVELVYEIFVVDEQGASASVFKFRPDHPDAFVFGADPSLIQGFVTHIDGLEQGAAFDFTLNPDEAFGPKDPDMIYELDKSVFEVDGEFDSEHVFEGARVPMQTQEGYHIDGFVEKITDDKITIDFNHQLAGQRVRYAGTVQLVRDATPEELTPAHHHCGCGCESCEGDGNHHHDCDCEGCGGCSGH